MRRGVRRMGRDKVGGGGGSDNWVAEWMDTAKMSERQL